MKKMFWGFFLVAICFLQSCDAVLILAYQVKNATGKSLRLKIENYNAEAYGFNGSDTIVVLKPGETFIVGRSLPDIGFPGEEKLIYNEYPSHNNFSILEGDSLIELKPADKEWKYGSGYSTFRITDKSLPGL